MEYKILTDVGQELQKKLNQWKHQYEIKILGMTSDKEGIVTILLTRTPKI